MVKIISLDVGMIHKKYSEITTSWWQSVVTNGDQLSASLDVAKPKIIYPRLACIVLFLLIWYRHNSPLHDASG